MAAAPATVARPVSGVPRFQGLAAAMALTTGRLLTVDVAAATEEAIDNSIRLYAGGYFAEALQCALALLEPEPWRLDSSGRPMHRLEGLLPLLCWANEADCPAVGHEPARSARKLKRWAEEQCEGELAYLTMPDRLQDAPVGEGWDETLFAGLPDSKPVDGIYRDYGLFVADLELVLSARVRDKIGVPEPDLIPAFAKALLPFSTDGDIQEAQAAEQFHHLRLADVLEACRRGLRLPPAYGEERCWLLMAVLDLADGDTTAASRTVTRALRCGIDLERVLGLAYWPPMRDLLRTRALAPALGLTDSAVADYLKQFYSRTACMGQASPAGRLARGRTTPRCKGIASRARCNTLPCSGPSCLGG